MATNPFQSSSYELISSVEKQMLQDNFELFVNSNNNLIEAFTSGAAGSLGGFRVSYEDYLSMMSAVGVNFWLVRHGLDTSNGKRFCLIVTGIDANNLVITPHYKFTRELTADPIKAQTTQHGKTELGESVPVELINPWLTAWVNLFEAGTIPKDICKTSYGVLRGYNFAANDFLGVLMDDMQGELSEYFIDFYLCNHSTVARDPNDQPNLPGTIGVMIVLAQIERGTPFYRSAFYDISAPCPPTCPDLGS